MAQEKDLLKIIEEEKLIEFLIVNLITALRGLGVPCLIYLAMDSLIDLQFFIVAAFLAVTDKIDGWLARRWDVATEWGAGFDKTIDKIYIIVVYWILCVKTPAEWLYGYFIIIVAALIILIEFAIFVLGTILAKIYSIKIAARLAGKVKMTADCLTAGFWGIMLISDSGQYSSILLFFLIVTLVLALNSASVYYQDLKINGKNF